jgi:hypothetical protein
MFRVLNQIIEDTRHGSIAEDNRPRRLNIASRKSL